MGTIYLSLHRMSHALRRGKGHHQGGVTTKLSNWNNMVNNLHHTSSPILCIVVPLFCSSSSLHFRNFFTLRIRLLSSQIEPVTQLCSYFLPRQAVFSCWIQVFKFHFYYYVVLFKTLIRLYIVHSIKCKPFPPPQGLQSLIELIAYYASNTYQYAK